MAKAGAQRTMNGATLEQEALPKPTYENTFFVTFRCYDMLKAWKEHGEDKAAAMKAHEEIYEDFYKRLGKQRLYCRFGLRGGETAELVEKYKYGVPAGIPGWHRAWKSFHGLDLDSAIQKDRRLLQWFSNGRVKTKHTTHFGPSYVTFSRYAKALWEPILASCAERAAHLAATIKAQGDRNYGFHILVNGPGEPSHLETGSLERLICDYSPFAVAEFRDWLTHRGEYAPGAKYAEEGRKGGEMFAQDPSPAKTDGYLHKNFNETYGVKFTTWDLLYWDPVKFPGPLPHDADPCPGPKEKGHTAGGFHPPVAEDKNDPFWQAWNNEDPANPGFRQLMVKHYIDDMKRVYVEAGIPKERLYNDVILLGTDEAAESRRHADGDPPWVSAGPYSSVGFTIYAEPSRSEGTYKRIGEVLEMARTSNWGFTEYHPYPLPPELYSASTKDCLDALQLMFKYRPHYVEVEGWSGLTFAGHWGYVTRNTNFEMAWRKFFETLPDQPYYLMERKVYAAPPVREVKVERGDTVVKMSWSDRIWEDRPYVWGDWCEFSHFGVYADGKLVLETAATSAEVCRRRAESEEYTVKAMKR